MVVLRVNKAAVVNLVGWKSMSMFLFRHRLGLFEPPLPKQPLTLAVTAGRLSDQMDIELVKLVPQDFSNNIINFFKLTDFSF